MEDGHDVWTLAIERESSFPVEGWDGMASLAFCRFGRRDLFVSIGKQSSSRHAFQCMEGV